jgi:two-component system nitrate/nitrite response regulator NarL
MVREEHLGSERVRVLIAHEVRVIRDGLTSLLLQSPELTVVALPPQESGYKEQQKDGAVDIVLAVSELAADTALNQIQRIKNTYPEAKVVVIGVSGTENESLECIEAGASGYVLPGSSPAHLIETVKMVHQGEASCPPDILALLFERIASLRAQVHTVQNNQLSSLTQRELEVLQLVADGMSNKEIAAYLRLELQTVKNHVHSILEKLRVNNRREAAACTKSFGTVFGDG